MNEFIEEMRVGQRRALLQFQKGILMCNRSLQKIFSYLLEKYSSEEFEVKYLFTRRLNQDILENFFSYMRFMGGSYDHPTPVEIQYRLKWYILGKHSGHVLSTGEDTGDNIYGSLISMTDIYSEELTNSYDPTTEEGTSIYTPPLQDNFINITGKQSTEYNLEQDSSEGIKKSFNTSF